MGIRVTAAEAAQLVDRHERVVRAHLKNGSLPAEKHGNSWSIDTDALEQVPGWRIDRARLATLQERDSRTAETMAARLATLEREVQALKARVRSLEMGAPSRVSGDQQGASDALDVASHQYPTYKPPGEPLARSFSMSYSAPASGGTFRTRSDAARWLMRHGIGNEHTPKSWGGWREVELEPRAVLQLAMSLHDASNWRITWRLHQCSDDSCVCRELLGE